MVLGELRATVLVEDENKFGLIYSIFSRFYVIKKGKKNEEEKASEDQEDQG